MFALFPAMNQPALKAPEGVAAEVVGTFSDSGPPGHRHCRVPIPEDLLQTRVPLQEFPEDPDLLQPRGSAHATSGLCSKFKVNMTPANE